MSHENAVPFSDAELLSSVGTGETAAYGHLVDRYQRGLYNFAHQIVGNADDAKDVAQDAFIKVFEALPRLEKELNFSAYLYKTARNLALDEIKKRKRFGSPEVLDMEEETSLSADPQRTVFLSEQQAQAQNTVRDLPENFRMVLSLREVQDLTYEEISQVTGIPKNTLGSMLQRARLQFKQGFRMSAVNVEQLPKDCKDMLPRLSAYIDEELTEEEAGQVRTHLDDCPLCRLALEDMTEASKSYRTFIPLMPPDELRAETLSNLGITASEPDLSAQTSHELDALTKAMPRTITVPNNIKERFLALSRRGKWVAGLAAALLLSGGTISALYGSGVLGGNDGGQRLLVPSSTTTFAEEDNLAPSRVLPQVEENTTEEGGDTNDEATQAEVKKPASTSPPQTSPPTQPSPATTLAPSATTTTLLPTTVPPDTTPVTVTTAPPNPDNDTTPPSAPKVSVNQEGSNVTLSWPAVEDESRPVTYAIEIWGTDGDLWYQLETRYGTTATTYSHTMTETQERWVIWTIDAAGNESEDIWGDLEWHIDYQ